MPRLPRFDCPGGAFHIMNRGLARRTVFENQRDIRYFLSRVARAVRRGEIEVYAFTVLATHFHLLVRSPQVALSEAMRRIQNEYVRYFNRIRRRDGPLFRGRFVSRPVLSEFYWNVLLRYIDANPVQARLADEPWCYPHGSAARYVSGRVPLWLGTRHMRERMQERDPCTPSEAYVTAWGPPPTSAERKLVELRLAGRGLPDDGLDDLVGAAPAAVRDWMIQKARLADSTRPGVACIPPAIVMEVIEGLRVRPWEYASKSGRHWDAWGPAAAALLRYLSGETYVEIAERLGVTAPAVSRRLRSHRSLMEETAYATRMGRVAARCVRMAFPVKRSTVWNLS